MAFDYIVSLDLGGRRCAVFGDGPLAAERVAGLRRSGADVTVVTPDPAADVVPDGVAHVARLGEPGDLDGVFLAIVTREDDVDVPTMWDAAQERGVLFAALDDIPHCDFGAVSQINRGDLTVTLSTAGRAPALAKRLRTQLEELITPAHGRLVDLLHDARAELLPRTVPFDEWAARWADALSDLDQLVAWTDAGEDEKVVAHVQERVRPAPAAAGGEGAS